LNKKKCRFLLRKVFVFFFGGKLKEVFIQQSRMKKSRG
jgi:hypothetical protein